MNYKSIPPIIGCASLTIYSLAAQPQVQSIQGHRMARTADSDAPSPIPKIDGVSIVRDGVYRITDTRPMEQASKLLERKLGVSVWYEDPVWAFNGDLVQAADLSANRELAAKNPGWRGLLVARSAGFW